MAKRWEDFYKHVQPHVPGCPEVVIEQHLRDAAIDFCERSQVWVYQSPEFTTEAGQTDYFVEIESGALLDNILALSVDGLPINRIAPAHTPRDMAAPDQRPDRYYIFRGQEVRLLPAPDAAYTINATVALKPSLSSRGVPDFVFETHGRTIACGAIASLAVIPGKEWTNPDIANYYKGKFLREADDAAGLGVRRTNLRVRGSNFA